MTQYRQQQLSSVFGQFGQLLGVARYRFAERSQRRQRWRRLVLGALMGTPIRYTTKFSGTARRNMAHRQCCLRSILAAHGDIVVIFMRNLTAPGWAYILRLTSPVSAAAALACPAHRAAVGPMSMRSQILAVPTAATSAAVVVNTLAAILSSAANSGIANPYFYYDFAGVPNGTTSSPVSATFRCTITDTLDRCPGLCRCDDWKPDLAEHSFRPVVGRTDFITSGQSVDTPARR